MQHVLKSKVLAALLSVMIAVTFMPWYTWQTADTVNAASNEAKITRATGNVTGTLDYVYGQAEDGETIELLTDATVSSSLDADKEVKIEGAYKISSATSKLIYIAGDKVEFDGKVTLKTNNGGSFVVKKFGDKSGYALNDIAKDENNEYIATLTINDDLKTRLYLGLAAFEQAYADQLQYQPNNYNRPITVFNSENLTNVPEGVIILNKDRSGDKFTLNGSVQIGINNVYQAGAGKDQYEVIFDAQGGTLENGLEKDTVYVDKTADTGKKTRVDSKTATKEGYIFNGWYTDPVVTLQFEVETGIHNTVTLNADGSVKAVYGEDGTEIDNDSTVEGASTYVNSEGIYYIVTASGNAIRATVVENNLYDFSQPVTKDMTLYAHWYAEPEKYEVAFDLNGGKVTGTDALTIDKQTGLEAGEKVAAVAAVEKEGFTFGGWYDGDYKWDFNTDYVYGDMTLKAKWLSASEDETYDVVFDTNGGTVTDGGTVTEKIADQEIAAGNKVTKPTETVTKAGYTFAGWYFNDEEWNFNEDFVESDMTLKAKWISDEEDNLYSVKFDLNGGEYAEADAAKKKVLFEGAIWAAIMADDEDALAYAIELAGEGTFNNSKLSGINGHEYANAITEFVNGWTNTSKTIAELDRHIGYLMDGISFTDGKIYSDENFYQSVESGALVKEPAKKNLSKEGYTFVKWIDKATGEEFNFNETYIKANTTLVAQWKAIEYTVEFKTQNHGTGIDPIKVDGGSYIGAVADPVLEEDGWTFGGWFDNQDCTGYKLNLKNVKPEDLAKAQDNEDGDYTVQVYAKWTQGTYSVAFDLDGGKLGESEETDTVQVAAGETLKEYKFDETPVKKGYKFLGWYYGDKKWSFNEDTVESDMTLTAKWEKKAIVTIYKNADNDATVLAQVYVTVGEVINEGADAEDFFNTDWFIENGKTVSDQINTYMENLEEGKTFLGFFTKDGESFDFGTEITENTAIYGHWANKTYTAKFYLNMPTGVDAASDRPADQTVDENEVFVKPADPKAAADDWSFAGWFNAPQGGLEYDFSTKATANVKLYAQWTQEYSVQFDIQGHGQKIDPKTVKSDDYIGAVEDPEEAGYEFGGWFADADCTGKALNLKNTTPEDLTPITESGKVVKVYAKWTQKTYSVEVKNAEVASITAHYNEMFNNGTAPTAVAKEGYTFGGYYTDPEFTNEYDWRTPVTENITLYAKWIAASEDETCTVSFNLAGGTIDDLSAVAAQPVGKGNYAVKPTAVPTKEHAAFIGWFEKDADEEFDFDSTPINSDMTIYARWNDNVWEVSYDLNAKEITNGNEDNKLDAVYIEDGKKVTEPVTPIYKQVGDEMYIFGGWYTEKACNNEYNFDSAVTKDIVLYAKWIAVKKCVVFYDTTDDVSTPVAVMSPEQGRNFTYEELYGSDTSTNSLADILTGQGYTAKSNGLKAKTGYEFVNFYTDEACENVWNWNDEDDGVVTKNMSIYLKYEPIEYKILFDRGASDADVINGEEDNVTNGSRSWLSGKKTYTQSVRYNEESQLIPCKYERTGYVFAGWALFNVENHKQVGTIYSDESLINANLDEDQYEVVKTPEDLYLAGEYANYIFVATWSPVQYTVKYDANGGEGTMDPSYLEFNDSSSIHSKPTVTPQTKANAFTKAGYHFAGWSLEPDGEAVITGSTIDKDDNHMGDGIHNDTRCTIYDGVETLSLDHVGRIVASDTNITNIEDDVVTLYAKWVPCNNYHYTVTTWNEILIDDKTRPAGKEKAQELAGEGTLVDTIDGAWFALTSESKVGTTDTEVSAKAPAGFNLDEVNSTENLTIKLTAENYEDACLGENASAPAKANINIIERALAQPKAGGDVTVKETDPVGKKLVYNASEQELINPGKTSDGKFQYAIVPDEPAEVETEDIEWQDEVPTAVNAGTYRVAYYIKADETHKDTEIEYVNAVIAKKEIGIVWGKNVFNYDGRKHAPTATATGLCEGDTCYVYVRGQQTAKGEYIATAYELSNSNYALPVNNEYVDEGLTTADEAKRLPQEDFTIINNILLAKATPSGSKKIKVTWTGVSGATRYVVYAINCGKTTVYKYNGSFGAGTKTVTFKKIGGKKIKAHKSYKFYVQAYAGSTKIAQSNTMHCISAKTKGKYANPTAIYANQKTVVIGENKIGGVSAKIKMPKNKKNLGTDHVAKYRYVSSDKGIATVDSKGTIYGVHAGTCKVYTQTVNGIWCATTVIVR